jgi:pimeloyl-ACP methyl ester carboxylesterase
MNDEKFTDQTTTRRRFLRGSGIAAGAAVLPLPASALADGFSRPREFEVLLVHGAWADGSSWSGVIERLQRKGFTVRAVQLLEQTLSGDVALVRDVIDHSPRPLVVAGHSYGGMVISGATAGVANVGALVFVAAYAPEAGESVLTLNAKFPATAIAGALTIDDQGNATIEPDQFVELFAPDVPREQARVLAAVQKPINLVAFEEPAGTPGWQQIRSFYQVSTRDQVINPDLERFMAARIGATTIQIPSSHVSLISHARQIAELIDFAAST